MKCYYCTNPGKYLFKDGQKYCFPHITALRSSIGGTSIQLDLSREEAQQILFELSGAVDVIEEQLKLEDYGSLKEYTIVKSLIRRIEALL